ncbi:hypothetical protein [Acinetobacter indicus]|uniref:hypothetical protein n=1 Tax=Acinetobacter indicus TaxID=756892 RepID=UPI001D196AF7|nr:hypothetical protein [Acinetobacter indicus]
MITNFAYLVNSPEFKHIWFNHKAVMGHDFFGNKGQVVGDGGYFTAAEYQKYYDEIMNRGKVTLGVTTVGGGLGGRNVLGVDTWLFYAPTTSGFTCESSGALFCRQSIARDQSALSFDFPSI